MILVTGGSKGLGRAICERLSENGEDVISISRASSNPNFEHYSCDVTDIIALREVASHLKKTREPVSALINAAGIASMNLVLMTPSETVAKLINVNLLGTIYSCQVFSPLMIRSGRGTIINFSTIAVALNLQGEAAYVASKAGVEAFTKTFAREVSSLGLAVNCIAPGPIATDLIRGISTEKIAKVVSNQVIRKQFSPADVCDIVEIILDKKFSSISGQVLAIGGS